MADSAREDGWAVHGSRPGSSTSLWPASPVDEHAGFSMAGRTNNNLNGTYTRASQHKGKSAEPWRGGGASSSRSTASPTPSKYGQNYFLAQSKKSKSNNNTNATAAAATKSYVDETLFARQRQNAADEWESPWQEGANREYGAKRDRQTPDAERRTPTVRCSDSPTIPKPRNYYGKVWSKRNESYADELLFGPSPEEPDFRSPWDQNKKQTYVFDATDYKAQEIKKQLQNAAKNSRNKSGNKGPKKADSERVVHIERALRSQLAVQGEKPRSGVRSVSSSNRPSTPKKGPKFKDSYVDELLFGSNPPPEPDFAAPWDDNKPRTIHAFDGTNSTVTIHHDNGSGIMAGSRPGSRAGSRPGSSVGSRRGSTGNVQTLRPAWK